LEVWIIIGKELKNDIKRGVKQRWNYLSYVKHPQYRKLKSLTVHINGEQKTFTTHFTCNFGRSASSGPLGFCAPCYLKNQEEKTERY